ncbi:MAG: hypothetical protein JKY98_05050 [Gammaproteobacteria bacterium]|nr:hypothetical protein [Gammaproteobacteria bacterium]
MFSLLSIQIDKIQRLVWVLVLLSGVSFVSSQSFAAQADEDPDVSAAPWQWLAGRRDRVSRDVTALGGYLDEWLAGEGVGEQANETYLRVRLNQLWGSRDGYNSKLKIGGRLDLPMVSERWQLIFESDVEELNTLVENVLGETGSNVSIGGFRYQRETESGWKLSHDVGLRARLPADPFYRFKAAYGRQITNDWSLGFKQKIWHYQSQGWGYDTEVSFEREMQADSILRFRSELNFQDDHNFIEFGQSVALHRSLGNRETISYEAGVLGINRPNVRIEDYYVQVLYRRAVYEDWLIMEAIPQILVSNDESWHPQPRLLVNLEVLFFDF